MIWHALSRGKTFEDGGETLVYYCMNSGSTHLINQLAAFVLELLAEGPKTSRELLNATMEGAGDATPAEVQNALGKLLEDLSAYELVEARPPG